MKKETFKNLCNLLEKEIATRTAENKDKDSNEQSSEIEAFNKTIGDLKKCYKTLEVIPPTPRDEITVGAIFRISSRQNSLYLVLPVLGGKQFFFGQESGIILSPKSNLIAPLRGLRKGEKTFFQGEEVEILDIY